MEKTVMVNNPTGLHARPAAVFVQMARRFRARITVEKNGKLADAKSIIDILALGAAQGVQITLRAEGEDAAESVEALTRLVEAGLGEDAMTRE